MKYKETGNPSITYTSLNITGQRHVRGPSGWTWRQLRTSAEAWRTHEGLYGQPVHHQPQRRVCGWGSRPKLTRFTFTIVMVFSCMLLLKQICSDGKCFSWGHKVISTFTGASQWFYWGLNRTCQCFLHTIHIKTPSRGFLNPFWPMPSTVHWLLCFTVMHTHFK